MYEVHPRSNRKKENKKRMVTVRRIVIFFEYLKASIAALIALLSSSVQNSECGGNATATAATNVITNFGKKS
jgi:hypothetical protein